MIPYSPTIQLFDVIVILKSIIEFICKYLQNERRINRDDFGSFRIFLLSGGKINADKVNYLGIKGVRLIFYPGKKLRKQMDYVPIKKEE